MFPVGPAAPKLALLCFMLPRFLHFRVETNIEFEEKNPGLVAGTAINRAITYILMQWSSFRHEGQLPGKPSQYRTIYGITYAKKYLLVFTHEHYMYSFFLSKLTKWKETMSLKCYGLTFRAQSYLSPPHPTPLMQMCHKWTIVSSCNWYKSGGWGGNRVWGVPSHIPDLPPSIASPNTVPLPSHPVRTQE